MLRSAVTICLEPAARSGPFVFHGDLAASVKRAAELGFDAVEIFPPYGEKPFDIRELKRLLADHHLKLAAVGTGTGWVVAKLTLIETEPSQKRRAEEFVLGMMESAAELEAPIIIGSMQGRHGQASREDVLRRLADRLNHLGERAAASGVSLLYEPLNRYETDLFTRQADAADWLRRHQVKNVRILSDLFHMNIEEVDLADALRRTGERLGHVHFVDSNRRAAGMGHIDYPPIIEALREIGYDGYLSAEALPLPDSEAAARQSIAAFKHLTRNASPA